MCLIFDREGGKHVVDGLGIRGDTVAPFLTKSFSVGGEKFVDSLWYGRGESLLVLIVKD